MAVISIIPVSRSRFVMHELCPLQMTRADMNVMRIVFHPTAVCVNSVAEYSEQVSIVACMSFHLPIIRFTTRIG